MTTNYRPGKTEVLKEMGRDVSYYAGKVFCNNTIKKVGKSTVGFGKYFLGVSGALNIAPYVLPSIVNELRRESTPEEKEAEILNKNKECTPAEGVGGFGGMVVGVCGLVGQIFGYSYMVETNRSEYLAIPITTNAVSLGYEWYSTARKRVAKRNDGVVNNSPGPDGSFDLDKIVLEDKGDLQ